MADQRTTVLGMKRFKANGKHLELSRDLVLTPCRDLHSDCWAKIPNPHGVARNNSDPARDYHHIHARGFSTQLCQQTGPNAKRNNTFFFRRRTCFLTRKILRRRVVQKDSQTSLMQCFLTFCVHKSSWLCTNGAFALSNCLRSASRCSAITVHFPEIFQMTSVADLGSWKKFLSSTRFVHFEV